MIKIDVQQIASGIVQGFQMAWDGLGQPLVNSLVNILLNDPIGDIVLMMSLVTVIIGAIGGAFLIRRRTSNIYR